MAKAKITREVKERDQLSDANLFDHTSALVRDAGKKLKPDAMNYIGSMTVHFYKGSTIKIDPDYSVICQLLTGGLEEGLVDFGLKELRRQLMSRFGREESTRAN